MIECSPIPETANHQPPQRIHDEPDCFARRATFDRSLRCCGFADPKSFAARSAFPSVFPGAKKHSFSRRQPSCSLDTLPGRSHQQTDALGSALRRIGRPDIRCIGSTTAEVTDARVPLRESGGDLLCTLSADGSRPDDRTTWCGADASGRAISQR
jgi:hypothetical protein